MIKQFFIGFISLFCWNSITPLTMDCICIKKDVVHINKYAKPGDDITSILQTLIDNHSTIVIDPGTWYISPGIKLRSNITIKGKSRESSILKRNDFDARIESGVLFKTDRSNLYVFKQMNPEDIFDESKVKYSNIHFENLTIDFNRNPLIYSKDQLSENNIFGIVFSHCRECSIDNCCFLDCMNENSNNGCPAVAIFQSRDCNITDCYSEHVTFIKSVYSNSVTVSGNHCENSVGTCIELTCGDVSLIEKNYVNGVYWDVSCVGINSTNSVIRNNIIHSANNNTSCLTLGHRGYDHFSASGAVVMGNKLFADGVRSVLIQNGSDIKISNNILTCVLSEDSPTPTFGCIAARGDDNSDIVIVGNEIKTTGDKIYGAITYVGPGKVYINKNKINSKRGIFIHASTNEIIIQDNEVKSSDYSICVSSPERIRISDNKLTDGLLIRGGSNISIHKNLFSRTHNSSYIYDDWGLISISENTFDECLDIEQLFLINAEKKDSSFDSSNVSVLDNKIRKGPNTFVHFSKSGQVRQLRDIGVIEK